MEFYDLIASSGFLTQIIQPIRVTGCSESSVIQESKEGDNNFVKEFLRIIDVEAIPASTIRIGKRSVTKPRPIKIVMSNLNVHELG